MPKKIHKYEAELEMGDQVYKGSGDTAYDAISSFPISYLDVKLKGTISIRTGKKFASRFFYKRPLRKLIVNKLLRVGLAHNLEYLLDEPKEGIEKIPCKAVK